MTERGTSADDLDEADADLAEGLDSLPEPPRTMRAVTIVVMALTIAVCAWLSWTLRTEAFYAMSDAQAMDGGTYTLAKLDDRLNNRYVRARVELRDVQAVRFRRPLDRDEFRLAAAGPDRWVAYRVPGTIAGPRFVPPTLVAGRLVRVSDLGPRFRGLGAALAEATGKSADQAWVLVDGHGPQGAGWIVGLELLLLAFLAWNGLGLVRLTRRIQTGERRD
ncbi:MAG: hypothetical protein JRI68_02990 [Deltaproteobacteria bacterium]|nr:hypothetical protein [Deltaproteobacteria bacterium]